MNMASKTIFKRILRFGCRYRFAGVELRETIFGAPLSMRLAASHLFSASRCAPRRSREQSTFETTSLHSIALSLTRRPLRRALWLALPVLIQAAETFAIDIPSSAAPVTVRVESKPNLVRATGIVFSSRTSFQVAETAITKIGDKLYEVRFAVPRSKLQPDSVASAIAVDENGANVFAGVTPAITAEAQDLLMSVPECPGEDSSRAVTTTTPGTLKQLVDVRAERMEIVRLKIRRAMDGNVLAKLTKFEEAFGLTRAEALNPDLPPAELIDRLSRIQHALRKYQAQRPRHAK